MIVSSSSSRSGLTLTDLIAAMGAVGLLVCLVAPAVLRAREAERATRCVDRLRSIGLACLEFARVENGSLPSNRRAPYAGWNTQILPWVGEKKLFEQYDASREWWDAAANRKVGEQRIKTFLCPAAPHGDRWVQLSDPDGNEFRAAPTDYVASAGAYHHDNAVEKLYRGALASPGRYYGGSGVKASSSVRLSEITDGRSSTILVVEMADKPHIWRAGKQIDKDEKPAARMLVPGFGFGQWVAPNWNHIRSHDSQGEKSFGECAVNCSNAGGIYGFHAEGANVVFADGSVRMLKAGLAEEIMVALVSIADGEILASREYLAPGKEQSPNRTNGNEDAE